MRHKIYSISDGLLGQERHHAQSDVVRSTYITMRSCNHDEMSDTIPVEFISILIIERLNVKLCCCVIVTGLAVERKRDAMISTMSYNIMRIDFHSSAIAVKPKATFGLLVVLVDGGVGRYCTAVKQAATE